MVISTAEYGSNPGPAPNDTPPVANLTPAVFHIMVALARGDAHGYAIMRDVERLSGGAMRLGPGTLYRSVQRMVVDGLIEERDIALDDETDDERRRYYRLTAKGLSVARAEAKRLEVLVNAARARKLLGDSRRPGRAR
jgi:DNA-binding PadR family transcriptional regulator